MKSTMDKVTQEVEQVIAKLEALQGQPLAGASERSLRLAISLLSGALEAIETARFEAALAARSPSPERLSSV